MNTKEQQAAVDDVLAKLNDFSTVPATPAEHDNDYWKYRAENELRNFADQNQGRSVRDGRNALRRKLGMPELPSPAEQLEDLNH